MKDVVVGELTMHIEAASEIPNVHQNWAKNITYASQTVLTPANT
jgi:predicted transcriptional regulator